MKTLSNLPQDTDATHPLTPREQRAEEATARQIIREALAHGGFDPAICGQILIKMSTRCTSSMGRAVNRSRRAMRPLPGGEIKLSGSALWRRASPEKRRNTVIHELAHIIAEHHGRHAHDNHWKATMRKLGGTPKRCHSVDTSGIGRNKRRGPAPSPGARVWSFRVHQQVKFTSRKGQVILATVTKLNRKTVEVKSGLSRWRVPPHLLEVVSA